MSNDNLKHRTQKYSLRIINLVQNLPKSPTGNIIGNQLLKCGTSVGANYRAACRARSRPEFIAKVGIVIEEADESEFWLELIIESRIMKRNRIEALLKETNEILAIMITSVKTARRNKS